LVSVLFDFQPRASAPHHVKEEQDEMFPKAKKAKLDLAALGAKMLKRKHELQAGGGVPGGNKAVRAA
jgi:hypothetical protein